MSENTINRRKVAQGLAWTAPTVVATVAAPFAAASPTLCNLEDLWRYRRPENSFVTSIDADGKITVTKPADWEGEWKPTVTVKYLDSGILATGELDGNKVTVTTPDGVGDPFDIYLIEYAVEGAPTQTLSRKYEADWEGRTTFLCEIEARTEPGAPPCDTRELWMTQIGEQGFRNISIDAEGVITITKPVDWEGEWEPTVTVSYIGTDATATITQENGALIAKPPAGVDPFDIRMIESRSAAPDPSDPSDPYPSDSSSLVYREKDWKGAYVCSISSGGSTTS